MSEDNGVSMTDEQIVAGLRSEDSKVRMHALAQLCPDGDAILIRTVGDEGAVVTTTPECKAGRIFPATLFVSQHLGNALGLDLNWVPKQQDPNAIVVPGPGAEQMLR